MLLIAGLVGYAGWSGAGLELNGNEGAQSRQARVSAMQDTLTTLQAQVDSAKSDLAVESVEDVRTRIDAYRACRLDPHLRRRAVARQGDPDGSRRGADRDALDHRAALQDAAVADDGARFDHAEGMDLDVLTDGRQRADDRRGMNAHGEGPR